MIENTTAVAISSALQRINWSEAGLTDTEDPARKEVLQNIIDVCEQNIMDRIGVFCGSGLDLTIDWDESRKKPAEKLVFNGEYHILNANGWYDGYAGFRITVVGKIGDFDFTLRREKNWSRKVERKYQLQEFIEDSLQNWLTSQVD